MFCGGIIQDFIIVWQVTNRLLVDRRDPSSIIKPSISGIFPQKGGQKMASTKEATVRIDAKGRITLPRNMRKALGVEAGDTVFFRYDPKDKQLRIAPAKNPFDVLAEHAVREYKEGRTKTIEEYAEEHNIRLGAE